MFKAIGISLLVLAGLFALGFVFQGEDFFMYKFWAPKYEQARRETFEQTKSYTQGQIQELQNMQMEYIRGTADQKAAMASIILHRAADFDENRLPPDLRVFIDGLKSQATSSSGNGAGGTSGNGIRNGTEGTDTQSGYGATP